MRQNIRLGSSCTRPFSSLPRYLFSRTFLALGVIVGSGRSAGIVVLISVRVMFAFATIFLSPQFAHPYFFATLPAGGGVASRDVCLSCLSSFSKCAVSSKAL